MGRTKVRLGLFSLGMWLLGSLLVVDSVWAQGEVSFIARRDFEARGNPSSVTVGDFNGDGRQDLAAANSAGCCQPGVVILLGRGDGTFQAAQRFGVGSSPFSHTVGDFNGDGQLDVATANLFFGTVSILINNTSGVVVNDLVAFGPIQSTFTFTPDPTGCPAGFVGTFSFEARLTNTSDSSLAELLAAVTTITNSNLLQNANGGPGGVGARLSVPQEDGFTDGVLRPQEFVDVLFIICLTQRQPFTFVVAVLGDAE